MDKVLRAPALLRLGFHDCLKYKDGPSGGLSGGCDGCLNWKGVGHRFPDWRNFSFPNIDRGDNNGLGIVVEILERVCTEPDYPENQAPSLSISLRDAGKSRADLWAFSAIAAVEFTTETNNKVCQGNFDHNPGISCNYKMLSDKPCHIDFPRPIKFQTGRKDCTEQILEEPYQTSKEESHVRVLGNGKDTTDFFLENFGFTGRETVAIMGAHTIGTFHKEHSIFIYGWTGLSKHSFNNDYYANLARKNKVAFTWQDKDCHPVGDAEGRAGAVRWVGHVMAQTENGGPPFWVHENYVCSPQCHVEKDKDHKCCKGLQPGQFCQPDSDLMEHDSNGINMGCERYTFMIGNDETAINSEMGLYFDFQVTEDGTPYGCPNLEGFHPENWKKKQFTWTIKPRHGRQDPECPLQTLAVPEGSTPLYQIVEEFADDQDAWIRAFIPTLEKVLSNGYQANDLQDSALEYSFGQVDCNRPAKIDTEWYITCIPKHYFEPSQQFYLMPLVASEALAIQGESSGQAQVVPLDTSDDRQVWVKALGNVVNLATRNPLKADNAQNWIFDETNEFVLKDRKDPESVLTALCLGCKLVTTSQVGNENLVQYFAAIPKDTVEKQDDALEVLKAKAAHMDFFDALPQVDDEMQFIIRSEYDQRVIDFDGGKQVMDTLEVGNVNQLWATFITSTGVKVVNVGSKDVLQASGAGIYEWIYDEEQKLLLDSKGSGQALRRGKAKKDGALVGGVNSAGSYNRKNQFVFEPMA